MPNKKITNEHIKDLYEKFYTYIKSNGLEVLDNKKPTHIVVDITNMIIQENKFDWNETSLSGYLNNLIYMLKGESFSRTINKFAEQYLIDAICRDFGEQICENAKMALQKHKEYHKTKQKTNNPDTIKEIMRADRDDSLKIKNIILYGVPGVGKTHNIAKLIRLIEEGKSDNEIFSEIRNNAVSDEQLPDDFKERTAFVTFHQSFGYEDFIEGFRPNKEGQITIQQGIFKQICRNANDNPNEHYYLIIDEINRGNISKIFGELITLIEEDKRDGLKVTLPYSKEPFNVPSNLYIIGTMNSTDKSIALIDVALRRRFTFLKMEPNASLIENDKAKAIFEKLNEFLKERLGEDHLIGHSYLMKIQDEDDLSFVLDYKIKPLLEEYFYGDSDGLEKALSTLQGIE